MLNTRPVYRIGAAGLDPRDWRLIEIVFKHSQYNRFEFQLMPDADPATIDILIANTNDPAGMTAVSAVRTGGRPIPVIAAVPRGALGAGRHAISIDRLTLQLLPILNRVVEVELSGGGNTADASSLPLTGAPAVPPSIASATAAGAAPLTPSRLPSTPPSPLPSPQLPQLPLAPSPLDTVRTPVATSVATPDAAGFATVAPVASAAAAAGAVTTTGGFAPLRSAVTSAAPRKALLATGSPVSAVTAQAAPIGAAAEAAKPAGAASSSNLVLFPRGAHTVPTSPQQLRVLVVDDSPTVRLQLSTALTRMGLACDAVGSADDAIDRLAEQHYDLALLDVVMPNVDGYRLTRHLKRDKQHRQMPVILLTSKSSPFDLVRGALAGCDTYLIKPVSLKALEAALFKQLRKSLAIDDLSAMLRPQIMHAPTVPAAANAADAADAGPRGERRLLDSAGL